MCAKNHVMTQHSDNLVLLTDEMLGKQAAAGQRQAFEEIVRRYSRPLAEFAAGKTVSWQDAEDIVQETFMRAFVNIKSFNPACSLKHWLFTIAYRLLVSSWRKKKTVRLSDEAAELLASPAVSDATEDAALLWEAARQIGTDAYTALWLRYRQEMPVEDVAKIMQKTNVSVRVLLHRARRQLAGALENGRPERAMMINQVCSERGS